MDPLSMAASIGSLCGVAVKLISAISEFIDDVKQAPSEVQALNNELASLYAAMGHIKVAVQAPRVSEIPPEWKDDFAKLVDDCGLTLKDVQTLVDKAKITETTGSASQVYRTIKFVFKAKQVDLLRRRIVSQNGILQILLAALTETRGAHMERRLEEIHGKVDELVASRANVKEVLVVLGREDERSDAADYVLSDRTSRSRGGAASPPAAPAPPGLQSTAAAAAAAASSPARRLTGTTTTTAGTSTQPQLLGVDEGEGWARAVDAPPPPRPRNTGVEGLGQGGASVDYADIAHKVFVALRPSPDAQTALSIITTDTWRLARLRNRPYGSGKWVEVRPDTFDASYFNLRLKIDNLRGLLVQIMTADNGQQAHRDYWPDGRFTRSGCVIVGAMPQYVDVAVASRCFWGDDELTFLNENDAQEVYFCLTQITALVHGSWVVHAAALSHILSDSGSDSLERLDERAFEAGIVMSRANFRAAGRLRRRMALESSG